MKTYARIANGVVAEIIPPMTDANGAEIPIADRFPASFVSTLVDCSSVTGIAQGWAYTPGVSGAAGEFSAPAGPTLAQAQAAQIAIIEAACSAAILAGFTSSALGASRTYGSNPTDQNNLLNAALASQGQSSTWSASLWCANGTTWAYTPHTPTQVQQVNADWMTYRQTQQQKYASLIGKINAATTVAAVQAISW